MKHSGVKLKCRHCPKVFDRPGLRRVHEQVRSQNQLIKFSFNNLMCYMPLNLFSKYDISPFTFSCTPNHSSATSVKPPLEESPTLSATKGRKVSQQSITFPFAGSTAVNDLSFATCVVADFQSSPVF